LATLMPRLGGGVKRVRRVRLGRCSGSTRRHSSRG
jgi:hypothetical protein